MDQRSQWHMQRSAGEVKKSNILVNLRVERKWRKINKKSTARRMSCTCTWNFIGRGQSMRNGEEEEGKKFPQWRKWKWKRNEETRSALPPTTNLTHLWLAMRFKSEFLHCVGMINVRHRSVLSQATNSLNVFCKHCWEKHETRKIKVSL